VNTYLPVQDAESFIKLEEDLDTVKDLDKQLVRFLKSKDIKMDTVKRFDKVLDDLVIKMVYMETSFNWGQPGVSLKMAPLFALF
jgi:hypothetical protein